MRRSKLIEGMPVVHRRVQVMQPIYNALLLTLDTLPYTRLVCVHEFAWPLNIMNMSISCRMSQSATPD